MPRLVTVCLTGVLALAASTAHGQTFRGRLEPGDGTLESGEYRDLHRVTVRQGQYVRASLTSTDFDPYLLVRGAASADDDDSGEGLNALLTAQATASGELRLSVTSARAGETGAYTLVVAVQDRPFTDTEATPATGTDGRTVFSGELSAGGATLRSGEFSRVHTAQVRPGQHVRIDMASPAFDTYLIVSGALTAQNDDLAPGRTMSRVEGVAGGDGQIRIVATSARVGETGTYLIVVQAQDTPFEDDEAAGTGVSDAPAGSADAADDSAPVTGLRQPASAHETRVDDALYAVYGFTSGGRTAIFTLPVQRGDVVYTYIDRDENLPVVSLGMQDADALDRVQSGGAAAAMQNALGGGGNPRLTGTVTASATGYMDALVMAGDDGARMPESVRFLVRRPGGAEPAFPLFRVADGLSRARMMLQDSDRPWAAAPYRIAGERYLLPMLIDGFGGCDIDGGRATPTLTCTGPLVDDAAVAGRAFDRMSAHLRRAIGGQPAEVALTGSAVRQTVVDAPGGYRYALVLNRDGDVHSLSLIGVRGR